MKKMALVLSAASVAATGVLASGVFTETASAAATCPNNNWSNITNVLVQNNFRSNGINIRTGDGTSCTSVGQGQATHDTRLHCYSWNGSYYWDHLRNTTTAIGGWVREDNLYVVSGNAC